METNDDIVKLIVQTLDDATDRIDNDIGKIIEEYICLCDGNDLLLISGALNRHKKRLLGAMLLKEIAGDAKAERELARLQIENAKKQAENEKKQVKAATLGSIVSGGDGRGVAVGVSGGDGCGVAVGGYGGSAVVHEEYIKQIFHEEMSKQSASAYAKAVTKAKKSLV